DTMFLDGARNNFLLAAHATASAVGVSLIDVSTGDFWVGEEPGNGDALLEAALLRRPAEILLASGTDAAWVARWVPPGVPITRVDGGAFGARAARDMLESHFRGASLDALGVSALTTGLQAAGAALASLRGAPGRLVGSSPPLPASGERRGDAAGLPCGGHARAVRDGPGADEPRLALRHARRPPHPHRRAAPAPVDAPPAARPRRHQATPGGRRRPRGGARGPGRPPAAARGGGGPGAADAPRG